MDNFRRKGIIFVFLIIVICLGVVFYTVFHDDSGVVVPQLVGMSVSEASDALEEIGLTAKVDKVDSSEAENVVLTQDIEPGTKVKRGKSLVLQVSRGGKQTEIPDVRSLKAEDAVRRLEQEGFKVTQTLRVEDSEKTPGTVIAQNPCGGEKVDAGCNVELLVCAGGVSSEGMVYVPDLRGKTAEEAEILLGKSGLIVGEKTEINSSVKVGTVASTKPAIGARVEKGSAVTLNISNGQKETKPVVETDATKESAVKAVKTVEKPMKPVVKKEEKKAASEIKIEKQPKTDAKKAQQKEEAKKTVTKTETKKSTKEETKSVAKTESKKETKTETKSVAKTAAKTEAKQQPKQTETQKPKETAIKAAAKAETPTETKAAETKSELPEKSTRVRYVVPPLSKPMSLKITVRDAEGTHTLKDVTVKGSEVISLPVKYKGKANLSITLGGETIWQENYK